MKVDSAGYSPLQLAYLGDAVFELLVRRHVLEQKRVAVNTLHKKTRAFVNAGAQAAMYHQLEPILSEEESSVMRRGRNAKSFRVAKSSSVLEYRHATGVEALFGYLYALGRTERLEALFKQITISDISEK